MAEATGNGDPQIPRESGIRNFFKSISSKFSRHRETPTAQPVEVAQPEPEPIQVEEPQQIPVEEPVVIPEVPRPKNIARFIYQEIERKGLQPPAYQERGVSDFRGTNERIEIRLMHKLKEQEQSPDGYILGIGVSNIFSLLETFDEKNPPKGMVLVNTNPACIQDAKTLVNGLLAGVDISGPDSEGPQEEYERRVFREGGFPVDTKAVIEHHVDTLRKLAADGNIAVVQGDILNPQLLEILSELPEIRQSNNMIYLSNIADWIWRAGHQETGNFMTAYKSEDYQGFQNLHLLDPEQGHKNYFADTIQPTLGYKLRISSFIPEYKRVQLETHARLMTRLPVTLPRDQIEGPAPAVSTNYSELRGVPLSEIEERYKRITENPDYQLLVDTLNDANKTIPGYEHESMAIRSLAVGLWNINEAKQRQAKGLELTDIEKMDLEDEELYTSGRHSREEVEMAKIYLETYWRVKDQDPSFDSTGKTTGDLINILKAQQPPNLTQQSS